MEDVNTCIDRKSKVNRLGWIVTAASFAANLVTDGIFYSFGLFLSEIVLYFDEPVAKVSWVFSILNGISMLTGPLAAQLNNKFGFRVVMIGGSLLASAGFLLSSLVTSLDALFITIGLMGGIGFGLIYLGSSVAISLYMKEKRALATGIAMCGSGMGTFVFAPLAAWLLKNYALRGTLLITSGICLNNCVFGSLFFPEHKPKRNTPMDNDTIEPLLLLEKSISLTIRQSKPMLQLVHSPSLILFCIAGLFQPFVYVTYTYLYAYAVQLDVSAENALFLISIIGICNSLGRIVYGWISDQPKVNSLLVYNCATSTCGIVMFVTPHLTSYELLFCKSVIFGLTIASTAVFRPILLGQLLGVENVNNSFGLVLLCNGIGSMISLPAAGFLFDTYGNYAYAFYLAGSLVLFSSIICYPIGWVNRWENNKNKCDKNIEIPF